MHDLVSGGLAENGKGLAGKYPPGGGIQSKPFSAQAQYSYLRNEHYPSAAPPLVLEALNSALNPSTGFERLVERVVHPKAVVTVPIPRG